MADSALFPLPGVCYRLQSVGLVSYLDLYDIYDDKVITRPLHDGVEQQVRNIWKSRLLITYWFSPISGYSFQLTIVFWS